MSDELVDYEESYVKGAVDRPVTSAHTSHFKDLLLREELNKIIKEVALEHPSEVQQECIPKAIMGVDILCQAKSGTGKTAVFVLATLQQLNPIPKETSILVFVNTKEMAEQIKCEYLRFSKYFSGVTVDSFMGGVDISEDITRLKDGSPTVFIGTPGRTYDLFRRKEVSFRHVKYFIVDECDHILGNLKMRWDVQRIFVSTDRNKQTMMFSATFNEETKKDCLRFLDNPHQIIIDEPKLKLHGLTQLYVMGEEGKKESLLEDILDKTDFNQAVIFVKDKFRTKMLTEYLEKKGFPALEIHSSMPTALRLEKFDMFKTIKYRILVTTDLMSRGVDIQDVNLVINYDMPEKVETYLHRVGRAGRFETKGIALSIVTSKEDSVLLNEIQSRYEVSIEEYKLK
eukprot:jgi/Antlo1/574/1475